MVDLPLGVGNGGGRGHQPLLRRPRHAEGSGGIERGGGHDRLPLARIAQLRHPQLVRQR